MSITHCKHVSSSSFLFLVFYIGAPTPTAAQGLPHVKPGPVFAADYAGQIMLKNQNCSVMFVRSCFLQMVVIVLFYFYLV